MRRTSFANWPCSIARTIDVLGDWWTPLVLRECFYGVRRFDEFQQQLGIARNTLSDRLKRLVEVGLLEKRVYETQPVRHEYVLTASGRDFFPVLAALNAWGDRHLADQDGPPIVFHHTACDHDGEAEVVCTHCRAPLHADDVVPRPGPGYPARLLTRPDVRARFHLDDPAPAPES
ncbi:helix-turn-helix domain-containing protein [Actinocorallia sp. API 0066]|uniref:winged helix-turn-helix transcriptional regulator n=1 Tax=Actinocorallia sp. API 0066 TaxID=2896846 RepID=UPI0027155E84|nr:helix-turn-helix domain-containing protein [Actinocorallia sp. API 0066]